MASFINLVFAIVKLIAPADGAMVETLHPLQKEYLSLDRKARFELMVNKSFRDKLGGTSTFQVPLELKWQAPEGASIFELEIDYAEGGAKQTFQIEGETFARITNLELGKKYRWTVRDGDGEASAYFTTDATPPRLMRAQGAINLRDLGGWAGIDGRKVKSNMIFRGAGLRMSAIKQGDSMLTRKYIPGVQRITEAGIATMRNDFKIKTDMELRSRQETACMSSSILGNDIGWVNIAFAAYDLLDNEVRGREPFLQIFSKFLKEENYPILFHCAGGRDRTGTLAFMLNGLLGVSEDDLCKDWEATIFGESSLSFNPSRIERLLHYINSLPGRTFTQKIEAYFRSCGITNDEIAKFREIMLEKNP